MRPFICAILFVTAMPGPQWGYAQAVPPAGNETEQNVVYELLINGESFLVEGNRVVQLHSEQHPDTEYEVAIRVAPTQRYRMPTLQFTYERPATIERDTEGGHNVVRLMHELGYTMLIHDLGGTLDAEAQKQALDILAESVADSFREMQGRDVQAGKPHTRKFGENTGLGTMIRYRDDQGLGYTGLVYVLAGEDFSATCVIQYLDRDQEDVLPLVRKTLDSFQAAR